MSPSGEGWRSMIEEHRTPDHVAKHAAEFAPNDNDHAAALTWIRDRVLAAVASGEIRSPRRIEVVREQCGADGR